MRFPRTFRSRVLVGIVAGAALLPVVGLSYARLGAARDAAAFPAPGTFVETPRGAVHLVCRGSGDPVVLFEAGATYSSVDWLAVQDTLSWETEACSYDRPGLGWSPGAPPASTPEELISTLDAVIEHLGRGRSYILAGHSLGGWIVRLYQARHPEVVKGMVLIESAHEDQWEVLPPAVGAFVDRQARLMPVLSFAARFGITRLLKDRLPIPNVPSGLAAVYRRPFSYSSYYAAAENEIELGRSVLPSAVDSLGGLGDLPLSVVWAARSYDNFRQLDTSVPVEKANEVWTGLQRDFLSLADSAHAFTSEHSTHNINYDDPAVVLAAVRDVLHRAGRENGGGGS